MLGYFDKNWDNKAKPQESQTLCLFQLKIVIIRIHTLDTLNSPYFVCWVREQREDQHT